MLIVISPAKTLDFDTPPTTRRFTQPDFLEDSALLVEQLRELAPHELASMMGISDALAALNVGRYASWTLPLAPREAKQALLAFDGDVYDGLDARSLDAAALQWAQKHLRILSGLYGLLRPLDLMLPYRLEMGTRLANARGRDLYAFWGDRLANALAEVLAAQRRPVLVNLASEEYFKAVPVHALSHPVIRPVFQDRKAGQWKVVSFFAKRARGLMTRYAIDHRIDTPEKLKSFDVDGYAFAPQASDANTWVFRRPG